MSTAQKPAAPDDFTIDGYKLVNCLAAGHTSQVWEVTDSTGARRCAMKLLLAEAFQDPEQKACLRREVKAGKSFEHPSIIKYHEVVVGKTHAYFIMDLFPAPNLKIQIYNDIRSIHIRFKKIVEQTGMALEHIHGKGWLHRDIKPDNILANRSSEVRLIDFSLAARPEGALSRLFGGKKPVQGTRTYMAPEQIMNRRLSVATDVYSLGVTIYEMLVGSAPFKGASPKDLLLRHINEPPTPPSAINANITPDMDRVILKMMAKKPEERYASLTQFLGEFRRVQVFKEAPEEKSAELTPEELAAKLGIGEDTRLDSRADAIRQQRVRDGGPESPTVSAGGAPTTAGSGVTVPAGPPPGRPPSGPPPGPPPAAAGVPTGPPPSAPPQRPPTGAPPNSPPPGSPPPTGAIPPARPPMGPPAGPPPRGAVPPGAPPAGRPPSGPPPGLPPGPPPGAPPRTGGPPASPPPRAPGAGGPPSGPPPGRPPGPPPGPPPKPNG